MVMDLETGPVTRLDDIQMGLILIRKGDHKSDIHTHGEVYVSTRAEDTGKLQTSALWTFLA